MKFVCNAGLLSQEVEGELVLLDQASQQIHQLNEVAAMLWRNLGEPRTLEELTQIVLKTYEVDAQQAFQDVERMISEFEQKQLVRREL